MRWNEAEHEHIPPVSWRVDGIVSFVMQRCHTLSELEFRVLFTVNHPAHVLRYFISCWLSQTFTVTVSHTTHSSHRDRHLLGTIQRIWTGETTACLRVERLGGSSLPRRIANWDWKRCIFFPRRHSMGLPCRETARGGARGVWLDRQSVLAVPWTSSKSDPWLGSSTDRGWVDHA